MAAPIELRSDSDGDELRRIARASKDGRQVQRLLALPRPLMAVAGAKRSASGA